MPALPQGHRYWVLEVPFAWRAWAATQGVSWNATHKVFFFRGPALPPHLAHMGASPFSWEWHQEAIINGDSSIPQVYPDTWTLRPHQEEAVIIMNRSLRSGSPGFILADDVGTGKTLSSWGFVRSHPEWKRVLIVTTASALAHWRNTLLHAPPFPESTLIINYDRLGRLFESPEVELSSSRKKGRRKRLAKEGVVPEYDLILWDESHKCKNLDSARSIMMRRLNAKAKYILWLSATAGQTPLELAYLAPLLAQATGSRPSTLLKDFEAWCLEQDVGVCRGAFGKWTWERTEARQEKVRAWLFDGNPPSGLRRLPTDIAGWPDLERQLMPQTMDAEARQAFSEAWQEFRSVRMNLPSTLKTKAARESALVAQLRLRQKSSWLRIPSTVSMVEELLDSGLQVAVSVAFHDTLNELLTRLSSFASVAMIHGKMNPSEKERERLRFQTGEATVILFTVEEAISLHQGEHNDVPRILLVHDLRWSAIQQAQIEGRCHRDGRFAPVRWLYAPDTVEDRLISVLLDRVKGMKAMHGDDLSDIAAIDAALQDVLKLG